MDNTDSQRMAVVVFIVDLSKLLFVFFKYIIVAVLMRVDIEF